jgi:hypothetical protein
MMTETETASDAKSELGAIPRWAAIPLVVAGGIAAVGAGQFAGIAVAEGVALTVVMALSTSMLWWPLRRFPIAWIVTASVVIIHLVVVFAIPWPTLHRASKVILPIFLADILSVIVVSDKIERRNRAHRQRDPANGC